MSTPLRAGLRSLTDLLSSIRSFDRNIHYYLLTTLLLGLSVDGVYAVLFNLYLQRLDYNEEVIGLINSLGLFLAALLLRIRGSKRSFCWGQVLRF